MERRVCERTMDPPTLPPSLLILMGTDWKQSAKSRKLGMNEA